MQVQIKAENDAAVAQVEKALRYYLTGLEETVEAVRITVDRTRDPLGVNLYRCRMRATLARGEPLEVDEYQCDLALALNRAFDRTLRTLRRRSAMRYVARSA